jgi:hypothetical protein
MMTKAKTFLILIATMLLAACQTTPSTNLDRIEDLKKQLTDDAATLDRLEANEFAQLEADFMACDSMLRYSSPETIDEAFAKLQLTKAYIEQFKITRPTIKADIDSTLYRLDCLRSDIKSNYLSDSLSTIYLDDEAQHAELLSNQVSYFKDRFGTCQDELNNLKP